MRNRAATEPRWPWHKPEALDALKDDMVTKGFWRDEFGQVEKGPFAKPDTTVRVQDISREEKTGIAHLRITPVHGDKVYFEIGAPATTASQLVENVKDFATSELQVSFLCVDSKGEHTAGQAVLWKNRITIKHRVWQDGGRKMAELQSLPAVPIRYTTDGSNPKNSGGLYSGPFAVPDKAACILAHAAKDGVESDARFDLSWENDEAVKVDPTAPVTWQRNHKCQTTKDSFEFIERLKKYKGKASVPRLVIADDRWLEVTMDDRLTLTGEQLESTITEVRKLLPTGQVELQADAVAFARGQDLLDWLADAKLELAPGETA